MQVYRHCRFLYCIAAILTITLTPFVAATETLRYPEWQIVPSRQGETLDVCMPDGNIQAISVAMRSDEPRLVARSVGGQVYLRTNGVAATCSKVKLQRPSIPTHGRLYLMMLDSTGVLVFDGVSVEFTSLHLKDKDREIDITASKGVIRARINDTKIQCTAMIVDLKPLKIEINPDRMGERVGLDFNFSQTNEDGI